MAKTTARDKLLSAATPLMRGKGYHATSVDEICEAAGVSKGSFYHFFSSKEDLGLAVLEAYYTSGEASLQEGPHTVISDPTERSLAYLDHLVGVAEQWWSDGCLIGTFAVDLAETNPTMRKGVSEAFARITKVIGRELEGLGADAEGIGDAGEVAEGFIIVLEGALVLAKAHDDWSYVTRALERFRREVRRQVGATV